MSAPACRACGREGVHRLDTHTCRPAVPALTLDAIALFDAAVEALGAVAHAMLARSGGECGRDFTRAEQVVWDALIEAQRRTQDVRHEARKAVTA